MINFTAWPEMLAWPYLMVNGWLPYRDIAIAHTPLLLTALTLFFKIFGIGILQLKIFTWILISINITLLYFVAKKIHSRKIALWSLSFYLPLLLIFEGNGLWFDLAVVPFALLLYYFLHKRKYLISGIVFALGFLTKQTFIYFSLPLLILVLKSGKRERIKQVEKVILGVIVTFVVFLGILFLLGIRDDFYRWAIQFGIFYLPKASGQISLPSIKQLIFAIAPFTLTAFTPGFIPWVLAGFAGVYPRWELFHFQPALPFLALSLFTFFTLKKNKYVKIAAGVILVLFLIVGIKRQIGQNTRFFESDVQNVVEQISDESEIKNIYVVNYWDNIYALTDKLPATKPLIPYIPWYLDYADSKDIILGELEVNFPEIIVIKDRNSLSWGELQDYIGKYYTCSVVENEVEVCRKNK